MIVFYSPLSVKESKANCCYIWSPGKSSKEHVNIWLVELYRYDSILLVLVVIGIKWAQEDQRSMRKGHFCPFFDFFTPWFALECHSKILNTPVTWSHMSDIPLPNLLMIQLTRLNWLLVEKGFCDVIKWHHIFCISLSRTEKFPVVARCSCARFGLDPKRGSRLPKEYSQQVSKKCPFSNSFFPFRNYRTQFSEWPRVFTWQHCLISLIWPQENIQS